MKTRERKYIQRRKIKWVAGLSHLKLDDLLNLIQDLDRQDKDRLTNSFMIDRNMNVHTVSKSNQVTIQLTNDSYERGNTNR